MQGNEYYEKKRDEMYLAYQAALEIGETDEAQRLYGEYVNYVELCKGGE